MQILEDGTLTDSHGQKADFRNAILIMTTNDGGEALTVAARPLGFSPACQQDTDRGLQQALRKVFRPEFLNRMDEIICFQPLSPDDLQQIARLLLQRSLARLEQQGILTRHTTHAVEVIAQQGHDPLYGVRPMRRFLRRELENPAAELLLRQTLCAGGTLTVDGAGSHLVLTTALPVPALPDTAPDT